MTAIATLLRHERIKPVHCSVFSRVICDFPLSAVQCSELYYIYMYHLRLHLHLHILYIIYYTLYIIYYMLYVIYYILYIIYYVLYIIYYMLYIIYYILYIIYYILYIIYYILYITYYILCLDYIFLWCPPHMDAPDAKRPAKCIELRPGSNGHPSNISKGHKNIISNIYIYI